MAKVSKQRVNKIERYRKRADLRGRPDLPEIKETHKVKLNAVYNQEINSVKASLNQFIVPLLPMLVFREDNVLSIFDQFKAAFKKAMEKHYGATTKEGEPVISEYSLKVSKKVKPVIKGANKDHERQFSSYYDDIAGVDPLKNNDALTQLLELSVRDNVQRITTITEDYFARIEQAVFDGLRAGTSNNSIIEQTNDIIQQTARDKKANAKLIATDQIQKLNGDLDRIRQRANGGARYIWRTRNNARVRHDHENLDGAIFDWGTPPITVTTGKRAGERNEPGQDINCKCRAEMVIEDQLGIKNDKITRAEDKTKKLRSEGIL